MGFFSQRRSSTTNIESRTIQGIDFGQYGILAAGNNQEVGLTVYDLAKGGPNITVQSGSPGASATLPTVGGLSWQVWALILAAAIFIFWTQKR